MANETTLTTLTELKVKSTLLALNYLYNEDVWGPLIDFTEIPKGSTSHIIPIISSPTKATVVGELVEVTPQAMDSGPTPSITPVEFVARTDITKHVQFQIPVDVLSEASAFLARSIIKAKNDAITTAATAGFTQVTGAAGTAMSTSNFEEALQYLAAAGAPGPYNFVSGAKAIYGPKGITSKIFGLNSNEYALTPGTNADNFSKTGLIGKAFGFNIYLDPAITPDANDDIKGFFFSKSALIWGLQDDLDVNIDYNIPLRTHIFVASLWGGASTKFSEFGVLGIFDVS